MDDLDIGGNKTKQQRPVYKVGGCQGRQRRGKADAGKLAYTSSCPLLCCQLARWWGTGWAEATADAGAVLHILYTLSVQKSFPCAATLQALACASSCATLDWLCGRFQHDRTLHDLLSPPPHHHPPTPHPTQKPCRSTTRRRSDPRAPAACSARWVRCTTARSWCRASAAGWCVCPREAPTPVPAAAGASCLRAVGVPQVLPVVVSLCTPRSCCRSALLRSPALPALLFCAPAAAPAVVLRAYTL